MGACRAFYVALTVYPAILKNLLGTQHLLKLFNVQDIIQTFSDIVHKLRHIGRRQFCKVSTLECINL